MPLIYDDEWDASQESDVQAANAFDRLTAANEAPVSRNRWLEDRVTKLEAVHRAWRGLWGNNPQVSWGDVEAACKEAGVKP